MRNLCRTITLCVIVFSLSEASAMAEGYYVWNGSSLTHEKYADPAQASNIEEWQIWLFPKDVPAMTIPKLRWGLITGKTAASVNKQLEGSQKFEKYYEKFFNTPWGKDTFFNPLGPIAVINKQRERSIVDKISEVWDQTSEIREIHESVKDILSEELEEKTYANTGSVLKEYADNFKDIFELQSRLRKTLDEAWLPMDYTMASLDQFSKELADLKAKTNSAKDRMGLKPRNNFEGKWKWDNSNLEFSKNEEGKLVTNAHWATITSVNGNKISGNFLLSSPDRGAHCSERVDFELTISKDGKSMHGWHENVIFEFEDGGADVSTYDDGQGNRITSSRIRIPVCHGTKSGRKEMTVNRAR